MKFKIRVRSVGDNDDGWWEDYDRTCTDANDEAALILATWNGGLRPNEKPRELLEVEVIDSQVLGRNHD